MINMMYLGGNIARVFTLLTEASGDMLLLASTAIPILANGLIFVQFLMYWNNRIDAKEPVKGKTEKTLSSRGATVASIVIINGTTLSRQDLEYIY